MRYKSSPRFVIDVYDPSSVEDFFYFYWLHTFSPDHKIAGDWWSIIYFASFLLD